LLTTGANYVSFDGVNNRVNILANDSTNITNNLSVEFIGNISTFNRYGILVHKYQSLANGWYISTSQNAPYNTIRFGLVGTDGSLHSYVSNIRLNSSEYYHTVVTYDGTTAHIYVNSVDSANPAYFGVPITGSSVNTSLYYSPSIFNNTKGNLLLFRMYNHTLTQAEVTQNYEDNKWRYLSTPINGYTNTKATPTITWSNPAAITYGTALSSNQLNAKASVPGSFVYSPASGTIPKAGTHILQTTFTPTDSANYTTASSSVSLTVNKATPVITWSNPADITSGTALSSTQLNALASVSGTFVYTPAAGTVLNAGTHTLHVDFTPADTANYRNASKDVTINLAGQITTPAITWSKPADITYGTALSSTQLNALASVSGTFVYTPASGTILGAGVHTLQTIFTPTDLTNYTTASGSVSLTVSKATPLITWNNPANISSGTPLGETQLNAAASVPGSFAYTPAAGTVLSEGTHTLQATFTPTDATNYTTASSSVLINVVNNAPAKSSSGNKKHDPVKLKILEPNFTQSSNSTEDIGKEIKPESGNRTINEDTGKKINSELGNKAINQHNKSNKGLETEQQETQGIPGFGIACGVTCLLGVLLYKRK